VSRLPLIGITGRSELSSGKRVPLPLYATPRAYVDAILRAGGLPLILPPVLGVSEATAVLAYLGGLLLSGGGDIEPGLYGQSGDAQAEDVDPDRDQAELALARGALRCGLPVLAICRGLQVLNVALGGTLYQDIPTQIPHAVPHRPAGEAQVPAHPVRIEAGSRLSTVLGRTEVTVNSYHHQGAREVAEGLGVTAVAPDGVVEGLEHLSHPFCVAVEWHPELTLDGPDGMACLFDAFVDQAGRYLHGPVGG